MSHNVEYFNYPEKVDKKRVQQELDNYAAAQDWQEGCQGPYHDIRWLDGTIYANYDEAEKAIEKMDKGNYDQLAVKFCYSNTVFTDAKRQELDRKRSEAITEARRRECKVYPKTLSSAFLGCKKCGSRLKISYLTSNFCPVCKEDLRPEYILKSIRAADAKLESATKKLCDYIEKHSKKEVRWLVKIEYHT